MSSVDKIAVVYARYSSHGQTEQSIEGQIAAAQKYAEQHGYTIIHIYADRAMTGRNDDREEFQRMLSDTATHQFGVILLWKIDRFGRNREEIAFNRYRCKKNGVRVERVAEDVPDGPEGVILDSVLEGMAEYYSLQLAQNVRRGQRESAKKSQTVGGCKIIGYNVNPDTKRYEVDPKTAPFVTEVFKRYANGETISEIVAWLNAQGVRTTRGGEFTVNSLHRLLKNEKYTGDALFQKTYTDGSFRRHETKNSSKQIFIENHHEAIISREIFETANRLLEQRAAEKGILKGQGKYQARYAFSVIIVCGECGGTFKRRIHDHGSEIAWACTTHIENISKCSMKYIRDDALKAAVTTMINKLIFGRKIILFPYLAELKRCNANSEEIKLLKAELIKEAEKIDVLRHLLADKIIKPAIFIQDQNASNKRSEELRRQITQLSQIDTGNSEMVAETEKLLHFLDSAEMQTEFKDFFATDFIEKIIVYDRHSIGIQLKCGLTLKEALL